MPDMESVGTLGAGTLVGLLLREGATFLNSVFGAPKDRMAHEEKVAEAAAAAELEAVAELKARADKADARMEAMQRRLKRQARQQHKLEQKNEDLEKANGALQGRVDELERERIEDQVKIEQLTVELGQAREELAALKNGKKTAAPAAKKKGRTR